LAFFAFAFAFAAARHTLARALAILGLQAPTVM